MIRAARLTTTDQKDPVDNGFGKVLAWGWFVGLSGLLALPVAGEEQILQWAGSDRDAHPCLYVTAAEVARLRQTRATVAALQQDKAWQLESDGMDNLVEAALLAENPSAQKAVIAEAFKQFDELIRRIPETTVNNVGPHAYARIFGFAAGLADAALAGSQMTAAQRASLLAKIARVGYLIHDPKYWNPATGKCSLCPNMTTSAEGYRLTIAALIPSHPMAKPWFDAALKALKQELDDWTDPQGGMVEAPHYSMVIFDQWVGAFLIARNAGAPDAGHLFDPKLRQACEWFANISTPRDARNGMLRRLPSLGHTYANERTGAFGLMAYLWRTQDPAFAARMQWLHQEHGSFGEPGILSYYPAMMGYRRFLTDGSIQPTVPSWSSACYPETGVQLRNASGSDRETTLYLIAGRNHSHYFNDSGSITLWGKGRELCDEDSYQFPRGQDSRSVHSMPDKPATFNEERVMAIEEFSASAELDYVRGTRRGWQRQIAFVKDASPRGPNYFVIADSFDATAAPTVWRLFLAAAQIVPNRAGVTVVGKDDVDMDIVFVRPAKVKVDPSADHLSVALDAAGTLTAVLYPRLKTEKPPQVTPLAGGKGVKVVTPVGTDFVFLNPDPFVSSEGGVTFEGKAGLVKIRNGKQLTSRPGSCAVTPGWNDGDRELRTIRWQGPQYPVSPDQ